MDGDESTTETGDAADPVDDANGDTSVRPAEQPRRFGPIRRELATYFEFLALATVSISVPLYDTLQRNTNAVFTSRHLGRTSVWLVALTIAFGPALVLWAAEVIVGLIVPPWRRWAHYALV